MPAEKFKQLSREAVKTFLDQHPLMVISTVSENGDPHTSTMLYYVDADWNIYIATHSDSFKAIQLRENPKISGVMWEIGSLYIQWHGKAAIIKTEKEAAKHTEHLAEKAISIEHFWPPIFHFRGQNYAVFKIKPDWMRALDLSSQTIHEQQPHMAVIIGKDNIV